MKALAVFLLVVLFCCASWAGKTSAQTAVAAETAAPFVTLDAVLSGSRSEQQSNWESGWGSYDRTTLTGIKLDLKVRNAGRERCQVRVITVFVARPLNSPATQRSVCGLDDRVTAIDPSRDLSYTVASPEQSLRDQNYATIGQRNVQGVKVEGWIVCVFEAKSNAMLAMKASTSALESLGTDRQGLALLVGNYQRSHPATAPAR